MATLRAYGQSQKAGFLLWENAGEALSDTATFGTGFVEAIDGAYREQVLYGEPSTNSGAVPITTDLTASNPDYVNFTRIIAAGIPCGFCEYVGAAFGGDGPANAINGGTVTWTSSAGTATVTIGSGATNAIHWVRQVCAAWNCGFYISVADYPQGPSLGVVDTDGITVA